jgi:hypothetical protein
MINRVNNKIKDVFGDITNEYVMVGSKKVAADNPDLVRDYFNPELYCHPKISLPIYSEFDDKGRLKLNVVTLYTSSDYGYIEYYLPMILCDITDDTDLTGVVTKQYRNVPLEFIPKEHFTECINDGIFYHKKYINDMPKKPYKYRQVDATKSFRHNPKLKDQLKYGIKSTSYTITEGKRYTFGAEIETSSGYLPGYLDKDLNYEAVHDGSLRDEEGHVNGGEYVTGVLVGDSGFLQLKKLCNELTKRCGVNHRCGVHVHIGGVNFNKEFIVHLYKLCQDIQKDLYAMLPVSRRVNEYCRELKRFDFSKLNMADNAMEYQIELDGIYKSILHYVAHTDRLDLSRVNKKNQHPLGNKCGYNHNTARYCWLNLVPAMFNTRGNGAYTIEIRSHSGTLSYTKIKNWILISMAIMWFAENEQDYIRNYKVKLEDVIKAAYAKKGDKLWEYVLERVAKFALDPNGQEKLDYQERELNNQLTLTTI